MTRPRAVDLDHAADQLAEIYLIVGPLYRRVLRAVEEDTADTGVTAGERAVLDLLRRHGPMTVPQVAREQELTRQFVQRMVNTATSSGLTELIANPVHQRSPLIQLTAAGHQAIAEVAQREHHQLRAAAAGLNQDQIQGCIAVLQQMLAAIELRPQRPSRTTTPPTPAETP